MLTLSHISKSYGKFLAIEDINLELDNGLYGMLAPNGAGKTTLIKMITTLLFPSGGEILYDGIQIQRLGEKYRDLIGYLPQQFGYYKNNTPVQYLDYLAALKNLPRQGLRKKIEELLELVGLSDVANKKMKKFSGGMIQRVGIAQAMLNDPKILILDEPTAGLDPKERIAIRNYISQLSRNKIILFATHVVSDIECIADEVLLIKKGKLIRHGTPVELIESMQGKVGEITCSMSQAALLQKRFKVGNIRQRKEGLALRIVGDRLPAEAVIVENNIDLEDVYLYYFE